MRRLAFFVTSAVLVATAALPAAAIKKTVRVPLLGCEVSVETNDLSVFATHRGVHIDRYGENEVRSTC